jgi:Ala-tRNA(Pro) deacylase
MTDSPEKGPRSDPGKGPRSNQAERVCQRLAELGIAFERYEHPAVATVEDAERHWVGIDATHCKNLFLRNPKGDRHYLVVLPYRKRADLRAVAAQIGDGRLSFASPERLMAHLGLTPGSVSPFGLINDRDHSVRVVLDRDLRTAARLSFHPNINTATLVVAAGDFARFLAVCGNRVDDIVV